MPIELIIKEIIFNYKSNGVHHNLYQNICCVWKDLLKLSYTENDIVEFDCTNVTITMQDGNVINL